MGERGTRKMYRLCHLNFRQRIRQHCSGYYHGLHARVRSVEIEIVASKKSRGGGDVWNGPGVSQRSPPVPVSPFRHAESYCWQIDGCRNCASNHFFCQ